MGEKGIGIVATVILAAGAAWLLLTQKKEFTLESGTVIQNMSTLSNELAKKVADAHVNFYEKIEGTGLKNIGDLGDAVKVPVVELPEYLGRLKDTFGTVQDKVIPTEVTQEIIDKYTRGIGIVEEVVEEVKEVITAPVKYLYQDRYDVR